LTTTADENNQHNELVDEDVPEDPPKPPPRPNRPTKQVNGPPSVKLKGELKAVEDNLSRENVFCSSKHNGICPISEEDECVIEINALCRETGPGGHRGEWETSRAVERDRRHEFDESLMCQ
jgi:hypothetical protein